MGIEEIITAPRSPWQSPYVERLIRRECLDHMIVLNEEHLRRILREYFGYYHADRPHMSLESNSPTERQVEPPDNGRTVALPRVGDCTTGTLALREVQIEADKTIGVRLEVRSAVGMFEATASSPNQDHHHRRPSASNSAVRSTAISSPFARMDFSGRTGAPAGHTLSCSVMPYVHLLDQEFWTV